MKTSMRTTITTLGMPHKRLPLPSERKTMYYYIAKRNGNVIECPTRNDIVKCKHKINSVSEIGPTFVSIKQISRIRAWFYILRDNPFVWEQL